jgi:hypothetical protein
VKGKVGSKVLRKYDTCVCACVCVFEVR